MHGKRSFSSSISRNTPSGSGARATTYRAAAALASVLRTYADPVRLKVRTAIRAGGIEVHNHNRRGFALMTPERLRAVSSAGGKRAHEIGVAHEFTSEEARAAGRKGGLMAKGRSTAGNRCSVCRKPGHRAPTCSQQVVA